MLKRAQNLFRKDLYSHYGCVNAIEFSHDGEWLVSGGDDRRILVWNIEKSLNINASPITMKGEHGSNIFCLGFDNHRLKLFSAGNDEQVIVHDFATGVTLDVFLHEEAVYGLTVDPLNDNVFASACEDGRILIWDIREPSSTEPFCLANSTSAFHAVMFNPLEPRLLATANSKEGVSLWDIRNPKKDYILRYGNGASESCMSVRFNSDGTRLLALRRRLPPILYNVNSSTPLCQFDHKEYYNSCTMKSCCFAGDEDQYVLSGSDDFNLYMWKIPEEGQEENWVEEAHIVLRGHRSIVNQVRFNYSNFILASSGVEKIIKLWSPFPMPNALGWLNHDGFDKDRKVYSHEEYINLILQSGQVMSHDYSHKSTMEDPRMMAFFDSLVQREIEGWNSDTSNTTLNTETWMQESALDFSDTGTSSTLSSDEDFANSNAIVSPSAIAYGLSVVTNHLDQDLNNGDEPASGNLPEAAGEEIAGGSQHVNRISQLIAQKRQQLMKAARAKVMRRLNRRRHLHSRLLRRMEETPAKTRHRLFSSTDDSSDSSETKRRSEVKRKLSELQSTASSHQSYRWRNLRKRRTLMTNNLSDSDSDMSNNAFGPKNDTCVVNSEACANDDDDDDDPNAKPSTSQEKTVPSNLVCYGTSDSSEEDGDEEKSGETKTANGDAANDKYGSSSTGTPDSGISSNACDNGELNAENPSTVWNQFKRIRSRLERVCRNYRTPSSD